MDRPTALLVDDDPEILELLADYLERNGFTVNTAEDGEAMWRAFDPERIAVVVLDVMLPGEDGLSLCRRLRDRSDVPIVMLTARGEATDRIVGLELGADYYLPKPFDPRELLAAMNSVMRRSRQTHASIGRHCLTFAGWKLDPARQELTDPQGDPLPLGSAEFRLLEVFARNPQRVLSRDELLTLTHGREAGPFDRAIDILVSRLRGHLDDDPRQPRMIRTVRAAGYLFLPDVEHRPC
ncbi:MAG: response regulator [Pseudomonadota bacterium]